jgi:L-lactate dehydrogenase complex protein LldF
MGDAKRFATAQKGARVGRLLARGSVEDGTRGIRSLPPPLGAWSRTREAPEPPAETFRQWWDRTRGGAR